MRESIVAFLRPSLRGQGDWAAAAFAWFGVAVLLSEAEGFDKFDPANISPFVAYLSTADCPIAGKVFFVWANEVRLFQPWTIVDTVTTDGRWTIEGLETAAKKWGDVVWDQSLGIS